MSWTELTVRNAPPIRDFDNAVAGWTFTQVNLGRGSDFCMNTGVLLPADTPAANPATSHFAALGTNRVHYLAAGQGNRTIFFVHGWAGDTGVWQEQIPALRDKARLVLIDLPGHGRSDKPSTAYTLDLFARAVVAVLQDTRTAKATLVGHSMGVPVICRVYRQAPDRVAALLAVDGWLRCPAFKPEEAEAFLAPFRKPDYRGHVTRFISEMFPNPGTAALRDRVLARMLTTPQHVLVSALEGMFGPDHPVWDLEKPDVPVLLLNARNPIWTAEYEAYVRSLSPTSDYRVIDGPGHFLMLEQPAKFNRALLNLLSRFGLLPR